MIDKTIFKEDFEITNKNRANLFHNNNLLYWYKKSYEILFNHLNNNEELDILEIGSGTSPIKQFYPHVKTSDVLPLNYIDYQFDANFIETFEGLNGVFFDIITFSNVLHHIENPIELLIKCELKLKPGGKIIFLEPYFSLFSSVVYRYIHHEYTNSKINEPVIKNNGGPLRTSNIVLPYLIFFKNKNWLLKITEKYKINRKYYFSGISYFLTGGFSFRILIPRFLYIIFFNIDYVLSLIMPKVFCSFFIIELQKKQINNT